jgi:riboflavin synthase
MFTGIITALGEVTQLKDNGTTRWLEIESPYAADDIAMGASIAHDGVCLTVIEKHGFRYALEASKETIDKTTLGTWQVGTKLNLERALKVGDELGGHWVLGHVDGLARITKREMLDGTSLWRFKPEANLLPFIAQKGSVTLNGTSLTVNACENDEFTLTMIPHTLAVTTWNGLREGDNVNIEIDVMARYAARLMRKEM